MGLWPESEGAQGLQLMFIKQEKFADLTTSQETVFYKNLSETADFFLLPFFLLLCVQRAKDMNLQGFNPTERAQAHDTVAVL